MTNSTEAELRMALAAAGCGILRMVPPARLGHSPGTADLVPAGNAPPKLMQLLRAVSLSTGVSVLDLRSPRRFHRIVRARMIYYALARKLTARGTPQIGQVCGGRDHSTVMHGLRRVRDEPEEFEPELSELLAAFRHQGGLNR